MALAPWKKDEVAVAMVACETKAISWRVVLKQAGRAPKVGGGGVVVVASRRLGSAAAAEAETETELSARDVGVMGLFSPVLSDEEAEAVACLMASAMVACWWLPMDCGPGELILLLAWSGPAFELFNDHDMACET